MNKRLGHSSLKKITSLSRNSNFDLFNVFAGKFDVHLTKTCLILEFFKKNPSIVWDKNFFGILVERFLNKKFIKIFTWKAS